MEKAEINKIKKVINQEKHYTTYFQKEKGELRIIVYEHNTYYGEKNKAAENNAVLKVLNKLSNNGLRPKYRIDHKTYQGYIQVTYIILS